MINRHLYHKDHLPYGIWINEPDYLMWIDKKTALTCMIKRHPYFGHLCGYCEIPSNHKDYNKSYFELDSIYEIHGGITYYGLFINDKAEKTDRYVIGFDCCHTSDRMPLYDLDGTISYKDIDYVKHQCNLLSKQIYKRI